MPPERYDPPASSSTVSALGSNEDVSDSKTPCDAAATTSRKMNNCGKRPRSPRSSPAGAAEDKFDLDEETQKYPASASAAPAPPSQQQQSQQEDTTENNNNQRRNNDEGFEGEYEEGEPHAKVARSSPVVAELPLSDDDPNDGEDEELLNINEQHQRLAHDNNEEQDSKPPAQASAASSSSSSIIRRRKKVVQQQQQQQRREAATKDQTRPSSLLPLAANLREFMKPGATRVFRPRPEWYLGDQNGNPNSAHRRRATSRSSSSTPHHLMEGREGGAEGQLQQQMQVQAAAEGLFTARTPVAAAALPFPLPPGLMVAPDSGLLPDGMFDFVDPRGSDAAQGADATDLSGTVHQPAESNNGDHQSRHHHQQQQYQEQQIPLLSTFGRDFDPALHVTIREAATEAALALLEWGAPVEAENARGVTPLILAAQKGNVFLVRELLRRGAPPSRASSNGTTAVLQAAHFGHLDCLELLFRAGGVSLMEMANFNHTTPLMRAAQEGHVPIVQMLLDRGAAVNRRNRVQMTALMLASQRGHGKVCQVLVNKGAELDSMTAQHSTSLLLACKRGHRDVVRVLVTAGCELWVQDSRGRTAREVAQRRDMKDLIPLLDSNVQLDLMQQQQRRRRNYDIVLLWNLLQKERAMVPLHKSDDEEEEVVPLPSRQQVTIHQMMQELQNPKKLNLSMNSTCNLPPTLPYHLSQKSTQALLRTMALPAPLVELIAKFIPMPPVWERRLGMLTKRSVINADATVTCALDLIDEVLEEAGFVEACDYAQVVPPTHFGSWREWKIHCRLYCTRGGQVQLPDDHPNRPVATTATVPKPKNNLLEMRRQVGFLQILANRTPVLANVLAHQPYNMPRQLIQQLITTSDIQSLVRRMGSRGVHFEPAVAQDLIMLVSRLCSWYSREREDKPYPLYPAVVHAPLHQPRQRPLPMRVPLDIVHVPFQYDPYQIQQSIRHEGAVGRERPSAPGPLSL